LTNRDSSLEQIEILNDEILDVERQLASGDIDTATANKLRRRYTTELETAIGKRTAGSVAASSSVASSTAAKSTRRMSVRALVGSLIVGVAVVAIAVFAIVSLNDDSVTGVEGIARAALDSGAGRDLDSVSNAEMEAVIAENPDVVPMRLALARRYFEEGDFSSALNHYFEVLDREQHPEALANVGWMTYLSGRPELAAPYLETALDRDPTYLTARWFLGNVYASLGRSDDAVVLLVSVANADGVPDDIRALALELISELETRNG
jgi:cytochrome c-type biogenesis protein CcmH/NrfG